MVGYGKLLKPLNLFSTYFFTQILSARKFRSVLNWFAHAFSDSYISFSFVATLGLFDEKMQNRLKICSEISLLRYLKFFGSVLVRTK
jgi:hypothetical protein